MRKRMSPVDESPPSIQAGYAIGASQNQPIDLATFLQSNLSDSATKVCSMAPRASVDADRAFLENFVAKLRRHLYPRVVDRLLAERLITDEVEQTGWESIHATDLRERLAALQVKDLPLHHSSHQQILLHSDRIYRHDTYHVNYTSYDLRTEQDIINPSTSRCNVMCLRSTAGTALGDEGHYVYARVLGIYHVNVVYNGPGSSDMKTRRFDVLWVRWYDSSKAPQNKFSLQTVSLPTVSTALESIDFLDPADVLRAAYIMPRFMKGKKHNTEDMAFAPTEPDSEDDDFEGHGTLEGGRAGPTVSRCNHFACQPLRGATTRCFLSRLADEDGDWNEYFVNRYAVFLLPLHCDIDLSYCN
jgi:hypothetical protein